MHVVFRCDPNLVDHLPPPQPARAVLPDWLKKMPSSTHSELHGGGIRTVKHCPPFVDAMTHGFVFTLACDVRVEDGVFSWDWSLPEPAARHHPRAPLSFHAPAQAEDAPFHADDRVIVKFNSFWTVQLPAGYSLFVMPLVNREDLPFRPLCGMVDADQYNEVGILFPVIWQQPEFEGVLQQGTPVVQCFPVARESLHCTIEVFDAARIQAFDELGQRLISGTGVYRKEYRGQRSRTTIERAAQGSGIDPEAPGGG